MYGWLDHWGHHHAKELIEEAERHRLARDLRDAGRNERSAGRRSAQDLAGWIVDLAWGVLAGKGIVEQPACEEHLSK